MQSSLSTMEVSQELTQALAGRVLKCVLVGVDGAFCIRCEDGTVASVSAVTQFAVRVHSAAGAGDGPGPLAVVPDEGFRPKLPGPLQDLLLQDAPDVGKPPSQTVTIDGGIEAVAFGAGASRGGFDWLAIVALPPFQMFALERCARGAGKSDLEHAIDVVQGASKECSEDEFFRQYADWFEAKGLWPNETPLGAARLEG